MTAGRPMRVLFVTNAGSRRCGVKIFGELWMAALREAGVVVEEWDGTWQAVQARGENEGKYLPANWRGYDLVHVNWHPGTINHYIPQHFQGGPPLATFLHDVPPHSSCPFLPVTVLVLSHEPGEGITVIDHAVPTPGMLLPYAPDGEAIEVPGGEGPLVGVTHIRDDAGLVAVEELCKRRGWRFNGPNKEWLSNHGELLRLQLSDVNVCWYHTSGRGKSMGAMFSVAACKPLVLSTSTMFSSLWPYEDELYFGTVTEEGALERLVDAALEERKMPLRAREAESWLHRAQEVKRYWEWAAGQSARV